MESHLERKLLHFNLKQAIETIHCVSPNFKHESTAGLGMGFEEVKRYCEGSVDLVVQLSRQGGRRGVAEIVCL